MAMQTSTAGLGDVQRIFELYDEAIEFQKTVFDKHWLGFDRLLVDREIVEGRLWKIAEDGEIACVYSIAYADPIIWGPTSDKNAMYIHRIVTNRQFSGRGYVKVITEWAKDHARQNGLRFVRMDTWGDNQKLIDYYRDCGFKFVGLVSPEPSESLPKHYAGISLSLFEIDLKEDEASL